MGRRFSWNRHCMENHIFFSRRHRKMVFPKKTALKYDLSCNIGKDGISFSRKYDLIPWTENERWSFWKKNTWKYDILFKCPEEMVFSKRLRWNMIFLVLSGKMVFFSQKHDIFSLKGKRTIIFLKKYIEKLYFLYIRVTNTMLCPSAKKKEEKRSFSAKIHLKVIDILDWHSNKGSSNSLYFYGDHYRRFNTLLSSEKKKTGNLIYGTAVIQPPRVVFGGVPEPHPRQLFDYQETGYNSRNISAAVKVF